MPYYLITSDQVIFSNSSASPGNNWVSTTLSDAVNQSVSSNLRLFILPSTIVTGPLSVTVTSGTPNRLMMIAMPGTVTMQLNADSSYLFEVKNIPEVVIDGIIFDAQNYNLTDNVGGQGSGILRVTQAGSTNVSINNCKMINANNFVNGNPQAGVVVGGGSFVRISNTMIYNCGYGNYRLIHRYSYQIAQ